MGNCKNCDKLHYISNAVYDATAGSLALTLNNTSNVSNREKICFFVNKNISNIVTGSPVQVYITGINGQGALPVYTKYGTAYPLFSDLLAKYYTHCCRNNILLHGHYVNNGTLSYVILNDVPRCDCANVTGGV